MNALARAEYVALRLVRRFLLNETIVNRIAHCLPYYQKSVNETSPGNIVSSYLHSLAVGGVSLEGVCVAEIGAGRTNVVAYGLAAAGARHVIAMEPFVPFDRELDHKLMHRFHEGDKTVAAKVRRAACFDQIADGSVDILLSNSVLEHVVDLERFFADCRRILRPGGRMLHQVDYRDHFFKYPYAFLTFTDSTWRRWLDPGDLPRWRLGDHREAMRQAGFDTEVLCHETLTEQFKAIEHLLMPRFAAMGWETAVTHAVLLSRYTP